jgi:hypothetical protein
VTQLRGADRFANYPGLVDIIAGINSKPSTKSTAAPPQNSPRGQSQEKSSEPLRQRRDSERSDSSRGRPESSRNQHTGEYPKLREVIEKVNSKKSEKSSLLPIHKNWQQPNQGYQPYRQVHPGQRGGNMNPQHPGQMNQGNPEFDHGNMMPGAGNMMQQRQPGGAPMLQRMQNPMMQQRQGGGMFPQQGGGNMGFNPGGNHMSNMGMMQGKGFNQGQSFGGNDMNNFNGMNNMNNPRMQQNMQQSNQFSLLNAPFSNNNRQMNTQGMYGNYGGQNMHQGGWRQ